MSNIKINDVPQRIQYAATNGQTQFSIPFPFFANPYVYVWQDGIQIFPGAAPGQYGITGAGSPSGGQITLVTPAILDSIITIQGVMPIDRTSIYSATISNLTGSDLNGDFNREVVMMKQIQTSQEFLQLQYAPWALVSQDPTVTRDRYLPILAPGEVFRMNDAGTEFEGYPLDSTPPSTSSPFVIYEADPSLTTAQNLGLLGNGLLKQTVAGGSATLALAIPGVDYVAVGAPLGTMAYQDSNNVNISGGVGAFTAGSVLASPVFAIDLVNKAYADSISAGFTFKSACFVASTTNLVATYANGASGVGATLTETGNGALSIDGVSPLVSSRVLIKNQSSTFQNGIYVVTDAGSAGTPYILTRALDFDSPSEIVPGAIIFIQDGVTQSETSFVQTEVVVTVGTSPILFVQFSQQYPLSLGNGGSGTSLTAANNSLVYCNATNFVLLPPQNSRVLVSSVAGLPAWDTTLPAGLTIPTPRINQINDANGNAIFTMTPNASAVNSWAINNSATGNPIQSLPTGSDTNISRDERTKGTGQFLRYSANTTIPFVWNTGTTFRHVTNWLIPDTSATRTVTLQDADGTFAFLTDRDWVLIQSQTANNTASVMDFTNLTGYRHYRLVYNCLTVATNGALLAVLGSINNGSSYLTSSGDYYQQTIFATTTVVSTSGNLTTGFFSLNNNGLGSTASSGGLNGETLLTGLSSTTLRKGVCHTGIWLNSGSGLQYIANYGYITNASAINALRIGTSSGNIFGGTATLYGMK